MAEETTRTTEVMTSENYRRLAHVETDIAGLKTDVNYLRSEISSVTTAVKELAASLSNHSRTDWKALGTWAALVVSAVLAYTTLVTAPLKQSIDLLTQRSYQEAYQDGRRDSEIRSLLDKPNSPSQ